jgi:hypothetical protein
MGSLGEDFAIAWLHARGKTWALMADDVTVAVDPGALKPGYYTATITVAAWQDWRRHGDEFCPRVAEVGWE